MAIFERHGPPELTGISVLEEVERSVHEPRVETANKTVTKIDFDHFGGIDEWT